MATSSDNVYKNVRFTVKDGKKFIEWDAVEGAKQYAVAVDEDGDAGRSGVVTEPCYDATYSLNRIRSGDTFNFQIGPASDSLVNVSLTRPVYDDDSTI